MPFREYDPLGVRPTSVASHWIGIQNLTWMFLEHDLSKIIADRDFSWVQFIPLWDTESVLPGEVISITENRSPGNIGREFPHYRSPSCLTRIARTLWKFIGVNCASIALTRELLNQWELHMQSRRKGGVHDRCRLWPNLGANRLSCVITVATTVSPGALCLWSSLPPNNPELWKIKKSLKSRSNIGFQGIRKVGQKWVGLWRKGTRTLLLTYFRTSFLDSMKTLLLTRFWTTCYFPRLLGLNWLKLAKIF